MPDASQDNSDPRDYILDINGLAPAAPAPAQTDAAGTRPYISVLFRCCNLYQRFYLLPDGSAYTGHCPKCARLGRLPATSVTDKNRFYTAG